MAQNSKRMTGSTHAIRPNRVHWYRIVSPWVAIPRPILFPVHIGPVSVLVVHTGVLRTPLVRDTKNTPGASPFSGCRSIRANLPCPYKEAPESCLNALLFFSSSLSLFLLYLPSPDLSFLKLSLVLFDFGQSLFSLLTNYHHSLS